MLRVVDHDVAKVDLPHTPATPKVVQSFVPQPDVTGAKVDVPAKARLRVEHCCHEHRGRYPPAGPLKQRFGRWVKGHLNDGFSYFTVSGIRLLNRFPGLRYEVLAVRR